jgi:hypothetical protein
MNLFMKQMSKFKTRGLIQSRTFSTLVIPDIVNNSRLHSSVNNLSSAAEKLGEKEVMNN